MKWVGISGGWQKINDEVIKAVRKAVKDIIARGDGAISGGALGVDYIALDEALIRDPSAKKIKIFLPTSLKIYVDHYIKRAEEEVITKEQAKALAEQLKRLKDINRESLVENTKNLKVEKNTYF